MQHPLAARRQAQPTGVIETLSAGFAVLHRQLWVLLLPVAVDLFLWFGPHVSYSPLVDPAVTRASEWTRQVALGPRRGVRSPQFTSDVEGVRQWLIAHTDDVNALGVIGWGPVALPALALVPNATGELAFISGWTQGVGVLLGCLVMG